MTPEPRPQRHSISPSLRFATLEKCGFRCHYCGIPAEEAALVVDHVMPITAGGSSAWSNLVAACEPCNIGKSSRLIAHIPAVPPMRLTIAVNGGRPTAGTPWQIRARAAGLTQRMLAQIVDRPDNTISRQLRGEFGKVPGDLVAIIIAWEDMAPEQRTDWLARVKAALDARRTDAGEG